MNKIGELTIVGRRLIFIASLIFIEAPFEVDPESRRMAVRLIIPTGVPPLRSEEDSVPINDF
jgi:hypothetical protein